MALPENPAVDPAEEAKRQRIFQNNLQEIVKSERNYAANLKTLIGSLEKTQVAESSKDLMQTRRGRLFTIEVKGILPLLREMLLLSESINTAYETIEKKEGASYAQSITDILREKFPKFQIYRGCVEPLQSLMNILQELSPEQQKSLEVEKEGTDLRRPIGDFLIQPAQRIGRYPLFMIDAKKNADIESKQALDKTLKVMLPVLAAYDSKQDPTPQQRKPSMLTTYASQSFARIKNQSWMSRSAPGLISPSKKQFLSAFSLSKSLSNQSLSSLAESRKDQSIVESARTTPTDPTKDPLKSPTAR